MSIAADRKKKIEQTLERAGVAWQLAPKEKPRQRSEELSVIRMELDKFIERYHKKFPQDDLPDPLALADENPAKAAVFFHPETLILSEEMRVMVWRLLHGDEIEAVQFTYKVGKRYDLHIALRHVSASTITQYTSSLWHDFYALRRLRATSHDNQPVLQGYYLNEPTGQT